MLNTRLYLPVYITHEFYSRTPAAPFKDSNLDQVHLNSTALNQRKVNTRMFVLSILNRAFHTFLIQLYCWSNISFALHKDLFERKMSSLILITEWLLFDPVILWNFDSFFALSLFSFICCIYFYETAQEENIKEFLKARCHVCDWLKNKVKVRKNREQIPDWYL